MRPCFCFAQHGIVLQHFNKLMKISVYSSWSSSRSLTACCCCSLLEVTLEGDSHSQLACPPSRVLISELSLFICIQSVPARSDTAISNYVLGTSLQTASLPVYRRGHSVVILRLVGGHWGSRCSNILCGLHVVSRLRSIVVVHVRPSWNAAKWLLQGGDGKMCMFNWRVFAAASGWKKLIRRNVSDVMSGSLYKQSPEAHRPPDDTKCPFMSMLQTSEWCLRSQKTSCHALLFQTTWAT